MPVEFCNTVNAPTSLDAEFFKEVLENGLQEIDIIVKKISLEMGSSVGDNYRSQIYRVRITFQRCSDPLETISVIVKSIPLGDRTPVLNGLREKIFYTNMLPRMEILLDVVKFGPKLYHTRKKPINTLVFEDISSSGYEMADCEEGLDMSHCVMVMKKLGQFHGVSMVLHKKDPDSMKSFGTGMLSEDSVNGSSMLELNIQGLIGFVSKLEGYESIAQKLKSQADNLKKNLIKAQLPIAGELKVLNHGDLCVNNLLFKYLNDDRKQVEDVVFVDLQMSVYGSPGYDLNVFFHTSLQLDVLKEKRELLLKAYHTSLCETLKAHSYKNIPSFAEILTEVRWREPFGFFASYGMLQNVAMNTTKSEDNALDNFMDEDIIKKKVEIMFSSKRLIETMKYSLKRFDEIGVLD